MQTKNMESAERIHPAVRIGHVHLRVADLERSVRFYRDLLGFEISGTYDDQSAFLSAGGYHHHLALNTWGSRGGEPPPPGHTGLYHFALLYPNRLELAKVAQRLVDAGYPIEGLADHQVSEAIYLHDPDGNGLELTRDRPPAEWPRNYDGTVAMTTTELPLERLLAELET